MRKFIRSLLVWHESGQSMILIAVLAPVLVGIMGLAVEGGRVFVEYRRMQAAADMAALVGAQDLPCGLTDTSCQTTAKADACTFAAKNGFSNTAANCEAGSDSVANAYVPPNSCSPYDFMAYGNSKCGSSAPPYYDYIEVQLNDNLGTIPIFNVPVTIATHAVAKHGIGIPGDYAIVGLDPNAKVTLDMYGSATVNVVGSAFANGGVSVSGNGGSAETCDGGWFSSSTVSNVSTDSNGTPVYAPGSNQAFCSGTTDNGSGDTQGGLPQISDPYSGSQPPPTISNTNNYASATSLFTSQCPQCMQPGYILDLTTGAWTTGTSSNPPSVTGGSCGGNKAKYLELFPGIYNGYSLGNCDHVYFNPGVYTFTGSLTTNHGYACVYGAPDCDSGSYGSYGYCSNQAFSAGTSTGDTWYANCSPYGYYDKVAAAGTIPGEPAILAHVPTYFDSSSGSVSSVPMNGITVYNPSTGGGASTSGNPAQGVYLAASNPCEGQTSSPSSVQFTAGASAGQFSYPTYSPDMSHGQSMGYSNAYPWSPLYPNMDFSLLEESQCPNIALQDWPGEFAKSQHLHFLWYILSSNGFSQQGTGYENYFGIMYVPNGTVSVNGNVNSNNGGIGPPWLTGQIVANDESFGGNSTITVQYRPCGPGSTACGSGTGTMLVQ